jgi:diguanylate cyclase (GGDEF)-like protein/PAS domain S-box-containing protein
VDFYQVLVEHSIDVMFHTVGGVLKWISPTVVDLLGWTPEELVGKSTVHLWHPDDREAAVALRDHVYATQPGRGIFRFRAKDGQYVWVETSLRPFADEDETVGAVGSMRNVTAQVESDKARAESEERFRLTMEHATTGMCLTSPQGRFILVNPAMCQMMGRDARTLMATTRGELTHPDDVAVSAALSNDLAAGRIPSFRVRKRYLKPDRSVVWGDVSVSSVRDDDGSQRYSLVQIVDVTDRVRTQKALAESERRYRTLVDGATEAMYEAAPDYRVTWMSPAITAILGWAPEELTGTVMADLVHPDDRQQTDETRARLYSGQAVVDQNYALRMRTKSGRYRWVSGWDRPVTDKAGSFVQVVAGLHDIDDLMTTRIRLQATLDTEFDPRVLMEAVRDDAGRVVDFVYVEASPAACEYTGRAREDLVGARLSEVLTNGPGSGLLEMFRQVVLSGEPLRRDDYAHGPELSGGGRVRLDLQVAKIDDGVSYTWRDVTERHATAEALAVSEERYRLLAENLSDIVVHVRDGVVAWVTPSLTTTLGWAPEDLVNHELIDFVHPGGRPDAETRRAAVYAGQIHLFRVRVRAKDNSYHWLQAHVKPFYDRAGNQDGIVGSLRIIDAAVDVEAELESRARSDALTGLVNRREVLERMAAMSSHPRRSGEETAVLFCDIDGFKTINDQYGHSAGDAVLQTIAARMNTCVRGGDIAARFGGDELLVLLHGVHELTDALGIADKIRRAAAEPVNTDGLRLTATLSLGVTLAVPGESVDDMIARADEAMYQAKQAGGDQVVSRMANST